MIVITGGGSGIGRALAVALSARGESVFIIGRREDYLMETAAYGENIAYLSADLSTAAGRSVVCHALKKIRAIKALVHNAAMIEPIALLKDWSLAHWHKMMSINVEAPLFLTQALLPQLKDGRVLHISSGFAHFPAVAFGGYCVSKAALYQLKQCWQVEEQSVAFGSAMPGIIDTDMQALIREARDVSPEHFDFFLRLKADNRLISPEVVAKFLTFLLLETQKEAFSRDDWDIYEPSHHALWLGEHDNTPELGT